LNGTATDEPLKPDPLPCCTVCICAPAETEHSSAAIIADKIFTIAPLKLRLDMLVRVQCNSHAELAGSAQIARYFEV
jgi:hypothetical protein